VAWQARPIPPAEPIAAGDVTWALGQPRPELSLPDLEGRLRQGAEWDGQVVVVNFWATWCTPCRREIPALVDLQSRYGERGLVTIGVAIDRPEDVAAFTRGLGVNYLILLGDAEAAEVSRRFGNDLGVLPFTAVVDRKGRIALAHLGEIKLEELEATVTPLL
jgi:thiol-disulfide isomerase/thioredoxin